MLSTLGCQGQQEALDGVQDLYGGRRVVDGGGQCPQADVGQQPERE